MIRQRKWICVLDILLIMFCFFLLQAFSVVFHQAIARSPKSDDVVERVNILIDCITYSVFIYTTRGLFEADKLIFIAQMAFQVGSSYL